MKLTLVYPGCHPAGGVERVVWEAARHLSTTHEVRVITAKATDLPPSVQVVLTKSDPAPGSFRRKASESLGPKPGLVVSFGTYCPPAHVLVMQSVHAAWVEKGAAVRVGPIDVPGWARRLLWRHQVRLRMEKEGLRTTSGPIVAVSEGVRDDLRRLYGVPFERMHVVPNGFDPAQCSPQRRLGLRTKRRQDLGLAEEDVVLLLVANEYHRKGLGVLLDAMAAVGDPRLRLLLVGRMAPTSYASRIRQLGLASQVTYCGATDDVALFHAAADLFVLPTQYEAFGSVIIEALASGLPVIASQLAGAAIVIQPGRNGLLLSHPLDAAELAGLLRQGLDPAARREMSERAPSSVAGFEWPAVMSRFEKVLEPAWAHLGAVSPS